MHKRAVSGVLVVIVLFGTLAAAPSAPAQEPPPVEDPYPQHTIVVGDLERTYRVRLPANYDPGRPVPLVVGIHGAGESTAKRFADVTGTGDAVDARGWIGVYPEGVRNEEGFTGWNAGVCCEPGTDGIDDVGFIAAVIDEVSSELAVDPSRVYVAGQSNGGAFAYRLACELPGRVAAFAVVGAVIDPGATCAPDRPISMLIVHGRRDRHIPFHGGADLVPGDWASVADATNRYRPLGGCRGAVRRTITVSVATDRWVPCAPGVEVRLDAILGMDHRWPGGPYHDPLEDGYDGTDAILDFFEGLRLRRSFPSHDFADVAEGAWYGYAADWVADTELLGAFRGRNFRPRAAVLSDAAQRSVARLLGRFAVSGGQPRPLSREAGASLLAATVGRSDVAGAIRWAAVNGVIPRRSDGRFHGSEHLTRAEFAAALYVLAATPSAWAAGSVASPLAL